MRVVHFIFFQYRYNIVFRFGLGIRNRWCSSNFLFNQITSADRDRDHWALARNEKYMRHIQLPRTGDSGVTAEIMQRNACSHETGLSLAPSGHQTCSVDDSWWS
jgi:hypothetical protein